jgi:hypothetical protein
MIEDRLTSMLLDDSEFEGAAWVANFSETALRAG